MMSESQRPPRNFRFSIDRGGTFTDVYAQVPNERGFRVLKLLSEDPANYPDAPREGIRRILEDVTGIPHPREKPVDTSRIEYIRMGTTVATNALLERKGERCALVTTKGFRDLLYIGNQSRPRIFDLEINTPDMLYERVVEVDERVSQTKNMDAEALKSLSGCKKVLGVTGEELVVLREPDRNQIRDELRTLLEDGIRSIAVVLLHSYTFRDHEEMIGDIAKEMGFEQVSLSTEVMPMVKIVPRGYTSCADAYLTPVIKNYVKSFCSGFDHNLKDVQVGDGKIRTKISFMQSDGGLSPVESFSGHQAILSGPAGGVVGYAMTSATRTKGSEEVPAVIGFDMGGTSTDVSRYDGSFEHVFETTIAGVTLQAPQLDIHTVAAGGGSRLFFRDGLFCVGPESAGAHPGPICYRKNGYLAVTDANLLLGRIVPDYFPKIFGPNEDESVDESAVVSAFEEIKRSIERDERELKENLDFEISIDEIASGFLKVANEAMCRPIRNLTQMKGYDISKHILACFGGAGPQHACAMAKSLGIKRVKIHRFSGILSAFGLSLAEIVEEKQEPCAMPFVQDSLKSIASRLEFCTAEVTRKLKAAGFQDHEISTIPFLNMRYEGTDCALMTRAKFSKDLMYEAYIKSFEGSYYREFGFKLQNRQIVVDDIRVRGVGNRSAKLNSDDILLSSPETLQNVTNSKLPTAKKSQKVYFEGFGRLETPVYRMHELQGYLEEEKRTNNSNGFLRGPAILMQDVATVVIEPDCVAEITVNGDIDVVVLEPCSSSLSSSLQASGQLSTTRADPIQLSIFSHRFMGIAEQMGRTLQRTSISVNIKERLDFSCALFGPDGGLVANAPHLPVHLGAMQQAVRFQLKYWKDDLQEGDVLVSNHPQLAGGSHLPDITVMTPVFEKGEIVFFVASRGHHADIGGIAPGSMPPLSKTLVEEGAAIVAFKLISGTENVFREKEITDLLTAPGKLAGNYGTRNLRDNLSDLRAQVAANTRGVVLMHELIREYSLDVVHAYMNFIQENAEMAVRNMLEQFSIDQNLGQVGDVQATDYMDDGSEIKLKVTIDRTNKSATFDFSGTSPEVYGNTNAPPAVTYSAIIYCLRCLLVGHDIPLNQGCLNPIEVIIPEGCILNPSPQAAVVGGNVLTSQRVTDVILKCFQACAASQGCMNNLTFGNAHMGYYETIAGGAGAGPCWHGRSGIHTHMTNTRITDPEILERRYPIKLNEFTLRKESGGKGKYRGGDGITRELEFLTPLTVSILSERRSFQPYGLNGGGAGERGKNLLYRAKEKKIVNLGGKNTVEVEPFDRLQILTPGGGGYGRSESV